MYCENCGTSVNPGSKFCSACGGEVQTSGASQLKSRRVFASERRRSSSQKLQTIILISIPALSLTIVMAGLIIPSTFQSTRRPEEQSAPKLSAPIADPLSPSDAETRRILDRLLQTSYAIPIGDATVTTSTNNVARTEISADVFKVLVAWSQAGLIDLTTDDVLSNSERAKGHIKRIKVTPTAKGLQFQREANITIPMDPKLLYTRLFTRTVSNIVENREVKKNVDLYRVVKGTFKTHWNEVGAKVSSVLGWPMIEQTNFIVLLTYDPFKKEWDPVSSDYAEADGQFKTNNVESYLATH